MFNMGNVQKGREGCGTANAVHTLQSDVFGAGGDATYDLESGERGVGSRVGRGSGTAAAPEVGGLQGAGGRGAERDYVVVEELAWVEEALKRRGGGSTCFDATSALLVGEKQTDRGG